MDNQMLMSIIEMLVGIVVEGIVLAFIFQWIANNQNEKQQKNIQTEMNNIETQNKFHYEQFMIAIQQNKTEIINQIKESANKDGGTE